MATQRYDVFLSHNSKDKPAVERIAEKLRQARLEPWLDSWYLPGGGRWQDGLESGLLAAKGCAYCLGGHGSGPWQQAELDAAQDLAVKDPAFQLFAVLLPGAPDPFDESRLSLFLRQRNWVDLRDGFEDPDCFQRLVNAVLGLQIGPPKTVELDEGVSPYRGLQVFDEAHAEFFFGRDRDIQRLIEKLKGSRFLAVVGASGSGKSSLVRAGLLPAVKNGVLPGSQAWPVRVFTPNTRPLDTLAAELFQIDPGRLGGIDQLARTLDELRASGRTLDLVTNLLLTGRPNTARLVLVVDQFEEVFTLCTDDAQRAPFLANLVHAATVHGGRCLVILTLRADFYARCAAYPNLATLLASDQVLLGPLDEAGLRAVIEQPARRVGVSFELGLVETILADVGKEPGSLPLLEHALLELWEQRQGTMLTLAAYHKSGGVDRALANRANAIFDGLEPAEQVVARRVLLRLTQPGEETEDTRRRAELDELVHRPAERDAVEEVVNRLVSARLLTTSQQPGDGAVQVDVAHEALIRAWPRLRTWLDEDREGLRAHRRLTEAAQEWEHHQRDPDLLYRGTRLAEAQTLSARYPDLLNEQESVFLTASVAARERELHLAEERRAKEEQQRKRIFAGLAIFSLVALLLAGLAGVQWRFGVAETERANQQATAAELARSESEAARATAEAETVRADGEAAVAAFERNNAVFSETTAVAAQALAQDQGATAVAERNNAVAESTRAAAQEAIANTERANAERQAEIALSRQLAAQARTARRPDLGLLLGLESLRFDSASLEAKGSLATALVSNPGLVKVLHGHTDQVGTVAHSPDGTRLISSSDDGTLVLWDAVTGQRVGDPWPSPHGKISKVTFTPDGSRVFSAGEDGTLILWDVAAAAPIGEPWRVKAAGVYEVVVSPDGTRVATDGDDGTILIWDVASARRIGDPWSGHMGDMNGLAFSPDGARLFSTGSDGTVRVWEMATGAPIDDPWYGPYGSQDIAISPDSTTIVTSGDDGIVWFWDAATGEPRHEPTRRHEGSVVDVAFSPDGTLVASAGVDGNILIWDAASGEPNGDPLQGHEGIVWSVDFSPDGTRLASSGADGTIVLWDVTRVPAIATFWPAQSTRALTVAFGSDGETIVTGGADGQVMIWTATTGERERAIPASGGSIYSVAVSPDGEHLAVADTDRMISLWDVATGRMLRQLAGHEEMVWMVRFSPDGERLVSASADGTVRLWETATGAQIGDPWPVSDADAIAVAFSPDGAHVASATSDGMVQLWATDGGRPLLPPWQAESGMVWDVAFTPDGDRLASVGNAGLVKLWNAETGDQLGDPWTGHDGPVYSLDFSPDGERLATSGASGAVVVWDVTAARPIHERAAESGTDVWDVTWSPDGSKLATAANDGTLTIWEAETLEPALLPWRQPTMVQSLAFSPTGRHVAWGNQDGRIVFWDVTTGEPIGTPWNSIDNGVLSLAFSSDGRRLAAATLWNIVLWDATTGTVIGQPWEGHDWAINVVTFDQEASMLASAGFDGTLALWNVATGSLNGEMWKAHDQQSLALAFSPDGDVLASGGRDDDLNSVRLWNVATRQPVGDALLGHNGVITGLAFSHAGDWLLSASADGTVRRWDVATGRLLEPPWRGHYGGIESMAISPDQALLVTAHPAGLVLWDVATGEAIGEPWQGHDGITLRVAFSPDGTQVISSGFDGRVVLWDVSLERWQAKACEIANRNLTDEEWRQYMGDEPYHETCPADTSAEPSAPAGALSGPTGGITFAVVGRGAASRQRP